jgi:hypothetical protein
MGGQLLTSDDSKITSDDSKVTSDDSKVTSDDIYYFDAVALINFLKVAISCQYKATDMVDKYFFDIEHQVSKSCIL